MPWTLTRAENQHLKGTRCSASRIVLCRRINEQAQEAAALQDLANAYDECGEYQHAISCSEKQLKILRSLGNVSEVPTVHLHMGSAYAGQSKLQKALDSYAVALDGFKKLGDVDGRCKAHVRFV